MRYVVLKTMCCNIDIILLIKGQIQGLMTVQVSFFEMGWYRTHHDIL